MSHVGEAGGATDRGESCQRRAFEEAGGGEIQGISEALVRSDTPHLRCHLPHGKGMLHQERWQRL